MQKSTYFLTINNLFKIWKANSVFDSNGHHRQNQETVFSISYWKKDIKNTNCILKQRRTIFYQISLTVTSMLSKKLHQRRTGSNTKNQN